MLDIIYVSDRIKTSLELQMCFLLDWLYVRISDNHMFLLYFYGTVFRRKLYDIDVIRVKSYRESSWRWKHVHIHDLSPVFVEYYHKSLTRWVQFFYQVKSRATVPLYTSLILCLIINQNYWLVIIKFNVNGRRWTKL